MTRLLCTGDLHLGQGADLGRQPGDRLQDQQHVWEQILQLAGEREVDALLFAGDAFEGPIPTSEHYQAFLRPIRDHAHGLPILAVNGNGRHDSATRTPNALQLFAGFGGTFQAHAQPTVVELAGCAVATLPWVSPARLVARHGLAVSRDEIHVQVAELLVQIAQEGKEDCERLLPGGPHLLLAHWSVSGSSLPNGLPVDQLREPVIPISDLEGLGFDAIVLAHIHRPQGVGESHGRHVLFDDGTETRPTHGAASSFYVGSPMPLSFGEASTAHGVWIIEPDRHTADGGMPSEFVPIPSRPFVTIDEHLSAHDQLGLEVACTGEEVEDAIARIRLTGTSAELRGFDLGALRHAVYAAGAAAVRVQPEIVRAERARVSGLDEQVGELDALEQWIRAEGVDGMGEALRARTRGYLEASV